MPVMTYCAVCPECWAENNADGARRFWSAPAPAVLHVHIPCRACWQQARKEAGR